MLRASIPVGCGDVEGLLSCGMLRVSSRVMNKMLISAHDGSLLGSTLIFSDPALLALGSSYFTFPPPSDLLLLPPASMVKAAPNETPGPCRGLSKPFGMGTPSPGGNLGPSYPVVPQQSPPCTPGMPTESWGGFPEPGPLLDIEFPPSCVQSFPNATKLRVVIQITWVQGCRQKISQ